MRRFVQILLFVLMTLDSCTPKESVTYMLQPHDELPAGVADERSFTKIFLAGTIDMGNSRDWQAELAHILGQLPADVYACHGAILLSICYRYYSKSSY